MTPRPADRCALDPALRDTGVSSSHSAFWDTAGCLLSCTRSPTRCGQFGADYFDRRNDITTPTPQFGAFVETTRYPAEEVAA